MPGKNTDDGMVPFDSSHGTRFAKFIVKTAIMEVVCLKVRI